MSVTKRDGKCPECGGRGMMSNVRCDYHFECWRCRGNGEYRKVTQEELYGE